MAGACCKPLVCHLRCGEAEDCGETEDVCMTGYAVDAVDSG